MGTQTWMSENLKADVARVDTTSGIVDEKCQINDVFV